MGSIASSIEGRMLCASNVAYSIPFQYPPQGKIPKAQPYYDGVGYSSLPVMIGSNANYAEAACTVGVNGDGIIVAFRGTVYNSPRDWLNDLLVKPITVSNIPGQVHDGFNNSVNAIIDDIVTAINMVQSKTNPLPIILTGHSKGGGMVPIAAYYLYNAGIDVSQLYLFAPPLAGTSDFVAAYNQLFPDTFMYENNQDIIPILPPDEVSGAALVAAFYELQTTISELVAAALAYTAFLGYEAVGSQQNSFFIPAPINGKYPALQQMNDVVIVEQLLAIVELINASNFKALADAHHPGCGFGYMSAINPTLCN